MSTIHARGQFTSTPDVLIVGAGVTGLALAIELRRRNLSVRIIDKLDEFPTSSRGKGVQPRTQEVFDDMGIIGDIHANSKADMRLRMFQGSKQIADLDLIMKPTVDVPYPNIVYLPEWRTEAILRARLATFGVSVERSQELQELHQTTDSVSATVKHTHTGEAQLIHARYLVGSDGGKSTVRKLLNLSFEGETKPEHFMIGDVEVDGLSRDGGYAWLHDDGLVGLGLLEGTDAWQIILELTPESPLANEPPTLELFQRLFSERTGRADIRLSNPTWLSHFRFNRRMVDRYQVGRVFVAGDAAHVHSPAGGQGMNTGIQDAYNLGWKLAAVVQGRAPDSLLETYGIERIPVAAAVLEGSSRGHSAVFSGGPAMTFLRERVLLPMLSLAPIKNALSRSMAQLGVNYRDSLLSQEYLEPLHISQLVGNHTNEQANLVDRFGFQRAPHAGDRAPNAHVLRAGSKQEIRFFDLFRGPHWTLLLFDGKAQTTAGYTRLSEIVQMASDVLGDDIRSAIVVAGVNAPVELDPQIVVLDPDGATHAMYGADAEALYLIRPDGYIGFRSQPADAEQLLTYLARIFSAIAAKQVIAAV